MKYWINTISLDHVKRGVEGGFTQANHGRATNLKRLRKGDGILFYSPRDIYDKEKGQVLRNFTAIGRVKDDELYQAEVAPDWRPYRRNIEFFDCVPVTIEPFIPELSFVTDKTHWGYKFRLGLFEIPASDFELIRAGMVAGPAPSKFDIKNIKCYNCHKFSTNQ